MTIFKQFPRLDQLNQRLEGSLGSLIGIRFTEQGEDYLRASLQVGPRTFQPSQRLHGGASAALAEEVGSTASNLCLDPALQQAVGVELSASHVRGISDGTIVATARALRIGRTTHVWDIRIESEPGRLICIARLSTAIIARTGS
jgi:1,4-dihydroxy-2-naphthoyl-CoA hydrolase